MCGILYINSKTENLDKNLCLRAFKTLKSRGPDKQLYEFLDKKNFLGNSILSITGKVKKGFKLTEIVSLNYYLMVKFIITKAYSQNLI